MSSIEDLQAKLDGLKEDMRRLRVELRCGSPGLSAEEERELTAGEQKNMQVLANLMLEYSEVKGELERLKNADNEPIATQASAMVALGGRYSAASSDQAVAVDVESECVVGNSPK